MITVEKTVLLLFKKLARPYADENSAVFVEEFRALGPTMAAVTHMLSNADEQKEYMPSILGMSANDPKWSERLSHYWNSISVDIPSNGKVLQVGFVYDVNSLAKQSYVQAYNKSTGKKFETDEDVVNYFKGSYELIIKTFNDNLIAANKLSNMKDQDRFIKDVYTKKYDSIIKLEAQKYKFGTPIDIEDYMLYRMCLVHSHVANEMALADKSNNIRFYLHSEEEIKLEKEKALKLETDRMEAFLSVVKDQSKLENVLYAMKVPNINTMSVSDKPVALNNISLENPAKFIRTVSNPNLVTIGKIEKYIQFGILNRIPNSDIIVDAIDSEKIIGNNIHEAITYFNNETNKGDISAYETKYKSLPKN